MKKVGVIGESPYDTKALCKVLNAEYSGKATFTVQLKRITGATLDSTAKMERLLKAEIKSSRNDLYVYVRDLDDHRSNTSKWNKRQNWFKKLANVTGGNNSVFLLNVHEIEAMILGDVGTFNTSYKSKINYPGNPESQESPKELLSRATSNNNRFTESDVEHIIPKLDFVKVKAKCQFYRDFIDDLDKMIR